MSGNLAAALRLVLVTDDTLLRERELLDVCRAAVSGGVSAIQLRLKHTSPGELCRLARALVQALPVPIFVNDRMDVAQASGAAGVHLGPEDLPVSLARAAASAPFVIGASVGGTAELENGAGADYWGVGPFRGTQTKRDAGAALGARGIEDIVRQSGGRPCVAIGGIRPQDVPAVMETGVCGVAVVSGILGADDVGSAARRYRAALDRIS